MRKLVILSIAVFLGAGSAVAQENPEVLQFMRTERSPRNMALAGAGAASVQSVAYSAFRAAALIPFSGNTLDAGFAFQRWQPGSQINKTGNLQLGAAGKIGSLGLSLGAAWQTGTPYEDFTPSQLLVALGAAYGIGEVVSFGLNARYAKDAIAQGYSLNGFSADVTVAARLAPGLTAVAGAAMLGPKVRDYSQPSHALLALAWHCDLAQAHALELMADAEYYLSGSLAGSAGLEYGYKQMVFVRGGYRLGNGALPSHGAVGLGLQFSGFCLDASYIFGSETLGGGFSVGLGYKF